jgi:peroxiredoxin
MSHGITLNVIAPDFNLDDFTGRNVRLSDYRGRKNIFLVFNRGFA